MVQVLQSGNYRIVLLVLRKEQKNSVFIIIIIIDDKLNSVKNIKTYNMSLYNENLSPQVYVLTIKGFGRN